MAANPVILTRIRVPQRRKDLLRRPRLLDVLHRNIHRKLTFVSAPAGYGKTALLLDFVADLETAVCWYGISLEHADLVTFAEHLIASLQQQFPGFGQQLTVAGETGTPDPYGLAIAVSNAMVAQVTDFCVIVLDDFHVIGEVQAIVNFVETLLDHLPEHVRFVAASRSVYGVPIVPLFVHEQLMTVGVKDLRFRADELQALVWQNYHVSLPADRAARLAEVADGWIIALLLAVRSIASGDMPLLDGHTDELYAFLAAEVLMRQPAHLQQFLLATSILEVFTEDLCRTVVMVDNAAALLQELLERNLFIVATDTDAGTAYQYHQLFADFLRSRLWTEAADWARLLHQRAASWFGAREDWERAVQHRLAAGNRADAAACMDGVAAGMYLSGRTNLLEDWCAALSEPPGTLERAPRLALYQAKSLIDQGQPAERSEPLLSLAEAALRDENDLDQLANVALTRSMLRRQQGQYQAALELAQEAERILGGRRDYRWLQAKRMQGLSLLGLGQPDLAVEHLQRAADGFRTLQVDHDLVRTLHDLTLAHLQRGDILATQTSALEAVQILRRAGGGTQLAKSLNNAGVVLYQVGRYREAWQLFEESLAIAHANRSNVVGAHLLNSRGDLLRDIDEWDLAEAAYESARLLGEANNIADALADTYASMSELERLRGNFNEGLHWLREATRLQKESTDAPAYQLGLGAIYLDMGQVALAIKALKLALSSWPTVERPRPEQVRAEFLLAEGWCAEGRRADALDWLAKALLHSAALGYDQFLVVAGRRAQALLACAAEAWPDHPQLRSLIERVGRFSTGLAGLEAAPAAVEPRRNARLEVLAFGPGQVRRDGEPIPQLFWRKARSRALFYFILEQAQVTRDEIALALWPDFSPDKVSSNFHATLWRLRQAIGQDALMYESDHYILAPQMLIWYDVADFEAFAKRAGDRNLSADEQAEAWRRAVALYQGPYLEGVDLAWVDDRRRQLESIYRLGLAELAEWEWKRGHLEAARGWYESLTVVDPYSDEACGGLLRCCIKSGALDEARVIYQAFQKRLADDLGAKPSPALQDLFVRAQTA